MAGSASHMAREFETRVFLCACAREIKRDRDEEGKKGREIQRRGKGRDQRRDEEHATAD